MFYVNQNETQRTTQKTLVDDYLLSWVESFLIDRKARGLAPGTIRFYQQKIKLFCDYCDSQVIDQVSQITPTAIRQYMLWLEDTHHNPGGRHAAYRALRAFLKWYEDEVRTGRLEEPHKQG